MAVSDLTNTTWIINTSVSQLPNNYYSSGYINYNINNLTTTFKSISKVISSGVTTEVAFHVSGTNLSTLYCFYTSEARTSFNAAIDSAGWYRRVSGTTASNLVLEKMTEPLTITINSGTKTTDADLIAWLEANAVQQTQPSSGGSIGFGTLDISKMYWGSSEVSKIYYGNMLIYEAGEDIPDNAILDVNGNVIKASDGYLLTTETQSVSNGFSGTISSYAYYKVDCGGTND